MISTGHWNHQKWVLHPGASVAQVNRRELGSTGLSVPELSLGTVKFGRNSDVKYPSAFELPGDEEIVELLELARDHGVNLIDTAPAYGISEVRIGELLPGDRADWLICTKAGESYDDGQSSFDFSSNAIRHSVERSLTRLNTDYLDLVLIHSDGHDLEILNNTGALSALQSLQSEGRIRAIGMSTKTVDGGLGAHLGGGTGGPPDFQGFSTPCRPATGPQCIQVTPVIGVQVRQEHFVKIIIRDHERGDIGH